MTVRRTRAVPTFAALGAALVLAGCEPSSDPNPTPEPTATRPNIVWLVAEDLSPIIPPFGDTTVETPNLSRLAAEGIRYTNAFSVSGVCAPSRFTLATGVYTTSAGAHHMRTQYNSAHLEAVGLTPYEVVPPPRVRRMSEILRAHGYYATNNEKTDHQFAPTVTAWDASGPTATWRDRPPGAPFFAVMNFVITHEGQVWAERVSCRAVRYYRLFGSPGEDPFDCTGSDAPFPNHVPGDTAVPVPPYLPDTEVVRRDLRRVCSNIVELDRQVGVVLTALESDGLLETENVAGRPEFRAHLVESRGVLDEWMRETDDKGARTEAELLDSFWPGRVQPVTEAPVATRRDGLVTLTSATEGASIGYRPSGTESAWRVYASPFEVGPDQEVEAIAHRIGFAPSDTKVIVR